MSLSDRTPEVPDVELPRRVEELLREADIRISSFQSGVTYQPASGFLASDFNRAYATLRKVKNMACGRRFCEWGAGFGVVAGLAATLGFEAYGIEVQEDLVRHGQAFLEDMRLPVQLAHGTIVSESMSGQLAADQQTFLSHDAPDGHAALRLQPEDFDVVYAYAWPHEQELMEALFDRQCKGGAFLVTYRDDEDLVVLEKN